MIVTLIVHVHDLLPIDVNCERESDMNGLLGWIEKRSRAPGLICLVVIAALITSCSAVAPSPTAAPAEPTSAPTPEPVLLRVLVPRDDAAEQILHIAVQAFTGRNPGAHVEAETADSDLAGQIARMSSQGRLPDLVWLTGATIEALAPSGLLLDLQDIATLDKNVDPNAPVIGCDCQRPPPPFRLQNITGEGLAASRPEDTTQLLMIPAMIGTGPKGQPVVFGFGITKDTPNLSAAWQFVRYLATEEGQRLIVDHEIGRTVLRALSEAPAP